MGSGSSVLGGHPARAQRQGQSPEQKKSRKAVTSHSSGLRPQGGHPWQVGERRTVSSGWRPSSQEHLILRTAAAQRAFAAGATHQGEPCEPWSSRFWALHFLSLPCLLSKDETHQNAQEGNLKTPRGMSAPSPSTSRDVWPPETGRGPFWRQVWWPGGPVLTESFWPGWPGTRWPCPEAPAQGAHPWRQCGGWVRPQDTWGDRKPFESPRPPGTSGTEPQVIRGGG